MKHPLNSLAIITSQIFAAGASAHNIHDIKFKPDGGYTSTVGAKYQAPNSQVNISADVKIDKLFERNMAGETLIQRITDRVYWVQNHFYNSLFFVGDKGVMVLDPLAYGAGRALLSAIKQVTDKPVTTLVYSHNHADHIGDAEVFVAEAKRQKVDLTILASDATADKMNRLNSQLPRPTKTVDFNEGVYQFEDTQLKFIGFEHAAHTDDSAALLLVDEGVIHTPDLINPDQLPWLGFGGSENFTYYRQNLAKVSAQKWQYLSGGHGNIGSRADLDFMQHYLTDLNLAANRAMNRVDWAKFTTVENNNHAVFGAKWFEAASQDITDTLRPKYGHYYGFEASVPKQAELVLDTLLSYQ